MKEFKKDDRTFDVIYGWGTVTGHEGEYGRPIHVKFDGDNGGQMYTKEGLAHIHGDFNGYPQLFHSSKEASEHFANIPEPKSKKEEMLDILNNIKEFCTNNDKYSKKYIQDNVEIVIEYFKEIDKNGEK